MTDMSSFLEKLEKVNIPSEAIIRATKIPTLLKKIKKLQEIPNQDEYHIRGRAASLLEKRNAALTPGPVVVDSTEETGSDKSPTPTRADGDVIGPFSKLSGKF